MENRIFLKRYRLSLGRNGLPVELRRTPTGVTYRGHEIESGREVSIELVAITAPDEQALKTLREDALLAAQIKHLNIPALLNFGVESDQLIYVTEYLDGPSAQAWVTARGPLSAAAVLRVAIQVVDSLGAAEFHRLPHRALNPSNIIFVPGQDAQGGWPIKLLRWLGPPAALIANEVGEEQLEVAARYASPEKLRGEQVNFASAVYSLGCVMSFLLTGTVPPLASPGAWQKGSSLGGEKLRGSPKIVRHLLGRMLRFDPAERPQDPVGLLAYLQTCLSRVERRKEIPRQAVVSGSGLGQTVRVKQPFVLPLKALALAALILGLATIAALVASGAWQNRVRNVAGVTADGNAPFVTRASLSRLADYPTPAPSASRATTVEPLRDEPALQPAVAAVSTPPPASPVDEDSRPKVLQEQPVTKMAEAATPAPEVTEAPAVTKAPSVAEAPEVTEAPAVAEAPEVVETSAVAEAPVVAGTPATAKTSEVDRAPSVAKAPEVTETPTVVEAPPVSEAPLIAEAPAVAKAPSVAEPPAVTEAPAVAEPASTAVEEQAKLMAASTPLPEAPSPAEESIATSPAQPEPVEAETPAPIVAETSVNDPTVEIPPISTPSETAATIGSQETPVEPPSEPEVAQPQTELAPASTPVVAAAEIPAPTSAPVSTAAPVVENPTASPSPVVVAALTSTPEPAPPAEGPDDSEKLSDTPPSGSSAPSLFFADLDAPPTITEPEQPAPVLAEATPPGPPEKEPEAAPGPAAEPETSAPPAPKRRVVAKKSTKTQAKPRARAAKRKSTSPKRAVKRATLLPKLRVGSEPVELVGTTPDGKWIVTGEESGRRIIVPPPPGYGDR